MKTFARIGAKVRVSDALSGTFEYGASRGNANESYCLFTNIDKHSFDDKI